MIHSLHYFLNSNAASVNTNLGCVTMGNLCLTYTPTVYENLLATPVVPPPNTRAAPVIPAGAIGPGSAPLRYAHNAATIAFTMFQNMDRALCQQILGSAEEKFVRVLHRPHRGYSGSITMDLLTHLYAMYAVITNADWITNDKRF